MITSTEGLATMSVSAEDEPAVESPSEPVDNAQLLRQSLEIASLEARFMEQRRHIPDVRG